MTMLSSVLRASGRSLRPGSSRPICPRCYATASTSTDDGWQVIIGLEIHAQIRSNRKLFSRAPSSYGHAPNTHVEPLDTAIPGSLPVSDLEAIRLGIITALASNCRVNHRSTFDRKHYFYHDIPASYQITQHYNPLARDGSLQISKGDNNAQRDSLVKIQQLQIEQDTAKSQVVGDDRLVDSNRAGTGLMEIVTDPDMRSAEEAGAFVRKSQSLLRRVGSGDGDMEKGNLRVDANISVHRPGTPFGTRCEIKNLNSVRYSQQAIEFERKRHIAHYSSSDAPLPQETRTSNEITGETMPSRSKENAEDYRYMPDSNLPAMVIEQSYLDTSRAGSPELPWDTINRISSTYGVPKSDVETSSGLDEYTAVGIKYLDDVARGDTKLGKRALNWIVHETSGQSNKANKTWTPETVPVESMRELVSAVESSKVTGTNAKVILKHVLDTPSAGRRGLPDLSAELGIKTADSFDLHAVCREAIDALPLVAADVRGGQTKAVGRLMGEVMRRSGGAADARKAREVILESLK